MRGGKKNKGIYKNLRGNSFKLIQKVKFLSLKEDLEFQKIYSYFEGVI
jgi:hypothetical protein